MQGSRDYMRILHISIFRLKKQVSKFLQIKVPYGKAYLNIFTEGTLYIFTELLYLGQLRLLSFHFEQFRP